MCVLLPSGETRNYINIRKERSRLWNRSKVNFLSLFLPDLRRLLIPIYDLQKKCKKFKWTEEAEKAFKDIKKLLINPPALKAPTPDGLFHLESDTSQEGVGGTLLQEQGNEWVVIGYHSKRLPQLAKNFSVTELELIGLLVNIHCFMQLLCNRYFEVLVDHKANKYMIKSKTESPTTRLKTLLLKLSEHTIDLKYEKGSEMHTSEALSRLQNITDTTDNKDLIPLNFFQYLTPNYIEHAYSHLVGNLYVHKTKSLDTTQVKRKHGRPPKASNDIASRELVSKINVVHEKSDRLTVAKLNTISKPSKQDYKSKLMTEKYLLLPINPQQLTPAQTALQRMSEKHLDFKIQAVNTIRPPEIEYTKTSQPLVPVDTPLLVIRKHIPRQSDIDKIEAPNYVVVNNFLFRIDTQKDKDRDKGNLFLLVIAEKYKPIILHTYHDSLLASHQGPYRTAMTIRQRFFIHNLMNKVKRYIEVCHMCLKTKPKYMKNRPMHGQIPVDYAPMQDLLIDIKTMPQTFGGDHLLLVITCDQTNFTKAVPLRDRQTKTIAKALIYRVIYLFGPPRQFVMKPLNLHQQLYRQFL